MERQVPRAAGDPALPQPRRRPLRPPPQHQVRDPGDGGPLGRGDEPLDGRDRPGRRRSRAQLPRHRHRLPVERARCPNIPGLDSFQGDWYHTGAWPHDGVDFTGKRVGVIGTGSSGVQSIPVIAEQAGHLTVFQRTPQYTVPARHGTVDKAFLDDVKTGLRRRSTSKARWSLRRACRTRCIERSALAVSDEERDAIYEAAWQEGGFKFLLALVQRHRARPPGQRHGVGVHPQQDPRDGQGPRGRREARARSTTRSRRSGR